MVRDIRTQITRLEEALETLFSICWKRGKRRWQIKMGGTTTTATPPTTTSLLSLRGGRATAPTTTAASTIPNLRYIIPRSSRPLPLFFFYYFVIVSFLYLKIERCCVRLISLSVCLLGCCVFVPLQAVIDGYWLRMR